MKRKTNPNVNLRRGTIACSDLSRENLSVSPPSEGDLGGGFTHSVILPVLNKKNLFLFIFFFLLSDISHAQDFFTSQKVDSVTSLSGQISRNLDKTGYTGIKSVTVINRDTNTIYVSFSPDSTVLIPVFNMERVTFPNTPASNIYIKGVASKVFILTRYGLGNGINYNIPGTIINTSLFANKSAKNNFSDIQTYLDTLILKSKLRLFREVTGNNSTVYNEQWVDSLVGSGGTHKFSSYLNSLAAQWAFYSVLTGTSGTDGFVIQFNSGLQFDWKEGTDWSFLLNATEAMKFNTNRELLLKGAIDQGAFDIQMLPNSSPLFGSGGLYYMHAGTTAREFLNFDYLGRSLQFLLPHDDGGTSGFFFTNNASNNLIKIQADYSITLNSSSTIYWGDIATDGSWRTKRDGNNLVHERRESGIWVVKQTITP